MNWTELNRTEPNRQTPKLFTNGLEARFGLEPSQSLRLCAPLLSSPSPSPPPPPSISPSLHDLLLHLYISAYLRDGMSYCCHCSPLLPRFVPPKPTIPSLHAFLVAPPPPLIPPSLFLLPDDLPRYAVDRSSISSSSRRRRCGGGGGGRRTSSVSRAVSSTHALAEGIDNDGDHLHHQVLENAAATDDTSVSCPEPDFTISSSSICLFNPYNKASGRNSSSNKPLSVYVPGMDCTGRGIITQISSLIRSGWVRFLLK